LWSVTREDVSVEIVADVSLAVSQYSTILEAFTSVFHVTIAVGLREGVAGVDKRGTIKVGQSPFSLHSQSP